MRRERFTHTPWITSTGHIKKKLTSLVVVLAREAGESFQGCSARSMAIASYDWVEDEATINYDYVRGQL